MHAWSWADICKVKEGLGIRRISDINTAASIRLFWRLYTSKNLWTDWMLAKYSPQQNWNLTTAPVLDSGTWKILIESKNIALQYMQQNLHIRSLGSGQAIAKDNSVSKIVGN